MTVYYIIEHPTRGVMFDLDFTDSGKVGRFSPTKSRPEAQHFATANAAAKARERVNSVDRTKCVVMRSPLSGDGDYRWMRTLVGPVEEPRDA